MLHAEDARVVLLPCDAHPLDGAHHYNHKHSFRMDPRITSKDRLLVNLLVKKPVQTGSSERKIEKPVIFRAISGV